ncbi:MULTISPECIES: transglycosylase SLT domain-containing protein [unclassified Chelatococcus]|uniref:lytic transglycosylase domain-containing protein n=1 Tax=unclassified Chelatococcus TaxID=2638111 RepID=UPI001BCCFD75|nr:MULTISPECIES: transglycosylase SLT domain-containing protein [unclassified Chelatococcus]MBS7737844.1 transglycosylase SLT domain-containing protein [Chelatococcus sp. HY11]MBX3546708.1 transglycosylase SLT domain-containing protein [Chelatococcus sp.]CAH1666345.1 Transglycosylase-like protein with SLT domain [Hyphomicrobiales bacterium]CAH1680668.1 Transglycosylase-like protein with SLT domain [Hyphomicrobiales bacterium]
MRFVKVIACISFSTFCMAGAASATETRTGPEVPGALDINRMGELVLGIKVSQPLIDAHSHPVIGYKGAIRVKAGKALRYNSAYRSRYTALIAHYAKENGLPERLVDAVMRVESRYKQNAFSGVAVGLMQIKPSTARDIGYVGTVAGLYTPDVNIMYGVKYLAGAYRRAGGDMCGTIMRYNSGYYAKRPNATNRDYCAKVKGIIAEDIRQNQPDASKQVVADRG